ncbi:MAG: hypothetical protein RLY93_18015 [Sumerlaeia bacterium]
MEKLLYTVTVPCAPESIEVLESLTETFLGNIPGASPDELLRLRLSVAEGCRNALVQQPQGRRMNVTTMTFWGGRFNNIAQAIEIDDPGPGLEVGGHLPPYPPSIVEQAFLLAEVFDEQILATPETPHNLSLTVQSLNGHRRTRDEWVRDARTSGYGLLTLCKAWERVEFRYDPIRGNSLRLAQPRPLLALYAS